MKENNRKRKIKGQKDQKVEKKLKTTQSSNTLSWCTQGTKQIKIGEIQEILKKIQLKQEESKQNQIQQEKKKKKGLSFKDACEGIHSYNTCKNWKKIFNDGKSFSFDFKQHKDQTIQHLNIYKKKIKKAFKICQLKQDFSLEFCYEQVLQQFISNEEHQYKEDIQLCCLQPKTKEQIQQIIQDLNQISLKKKEEALKKLKKQQKQDNLVSNCLLQEGTSQNIPQQDLQNQNQSEHNFEQNSQQNNLCQIQESQRGENSKLEYDQNFSSQIESLTIVAKNVNLPQNFFKNNYDNEKNLEEQTLQQNDQVYKLFEDLHLIEKNQQDDQAQISLKKLLIEVMEELVKEEAHEKIEKIAQMTGEQYLELKNKLKSVIQVSIENGFEEDKMLINEHL